MAQLVIITHKTEDKIPLYLKEAVSYRVNTTWEITRKTSNELVSFQSTFYGFLPKAGMITHLFYSSVCSYFLKYACAPYAS